MSHKLVVGITEIGKTRGCKILAAELVKHGKVLAYDVLGSKWPDGVMVVTNFEDFDWAYWSETDWLAVFIDEAGETVKRFDGDMEKTATRGRHPGHQNFYIVQGLTLMSLQARKQCVGVYLYNCESDDAEKLYASFGRKKQANDPYLEIFNAPAYGPGEFIYFTKLVPPVKYRVNFEQNTIEKVAVDTVK